MKRREFITLLGGAAATWPLAARAQQSAMPVIGLINPGSRNAFAERLDAFHQGLSETGFIERHNVSVEYRWANGRYDRLPEMAADLVLRNVNVIAALGGAPAALAAKAATTSIPIVFMVASDPVRIGLVPSLNRPMGNLTGVTTLGLELAPKRLELLREIVPAARAVAALVNPKVTSAASETTKFRVVADRLGLHAHVLKASSEEDFDTAFATMKQLGIDAVLILADPFFNTQVGQLARLSVRHTIPASYQYREFVEAGGLMSYGVKGSFREPYHQTGIYTGRILRGKTPAELPVMQPTKFELFINSKTAKALGLDIPPTLLARADEVIE